MKPLERQDLASLLRQVASEPRPRERLIAGLSRPCWPGGTEDRVNVPGREWLRKHGPAKAQPVVLDCRCATTGRCRLCN